ncbi:hypothetical protein MMC30_008448 [Trapelia coarctata]|nr:hypothetical protein [Trapelia coarctata]
MDPRKGFRSWRGGQNRGRGNRGQRGRPSNRPRLELLPSNRTHSNPFGFQAVPANRRVPLADDHPLNVELADARHEQNLRTIRWARLFDTIPEDMANPGSYDYQQWQAEMGESEEKVTDILRRISNAEHGTATVQPPVNAPLRQTQPSRGRSVMNPAQRRQDKTRERIRQEQRVSLDPGPDRQPHEQSARESIFHDRAGRTHNPTAGSINEQSHGILWTPEMQANAVHQFHRGIQPFSSPPLLIGSVEDSPPPFSPVATGNSTGSNHGDSFMSDDAIFSEAEAEREAERNAQAMFEAAEAEREEERLRQAMTGASISREPTAEAAVPLETPVPSPLHVLSPDRLARIFPRQGSQDLCPTTPDRPVMDQEIFGGLRRAKASSSTGSLLESDTAMNEATEAAAQDSASDLPRLRAIDPRMQAAALAAMGMDVASDDAVSSSPIRQADPESRSSSEAPIIRRRAQRAVDPELQSSDEPLRRVDPVMQAFALAALQDEEDESVQEETGVGPQKRKLRSYKGSSSPEEGEIKKPRYNLRPRLSTSSGNSKADPNSSSSEFSSEEGDAAFASGVSPRITRQHSSPTSDRDVASRPVVGDDLASVLSTDKPAAPVHASTTPAAPQSASHRTPTRSLFIRHLVNEFEVQALFPNGDRVHLVAILKNDKGHYVARFDNHENAKVALERQPAEHKVGQRTIQPGARRLPYVKWFDERGGFEGFVDQDEDGDEVDFEAFGPQHVAAPSPRELHHDPDEQPAHASSSFPAASSNVAVEPTPPTIQSLISAQQSKAPVAGPSSSGSSSSAKPKTARQKAAEAGLTIAERERRAEIAVEAQDMMDVINASFHTMPRRQVISHLHFVNDELSEVAEVKARKASGGTLTTAEQKRVNRKSDVLHYRRDLLQYLGL